MTITGWRLWVLILAIGALGVACSKSNGAPPPAAPATEVEAEPEEPRVPVSVTAPRRDAISAYYATSTTLRAEKTATVTSRAGGVVKRFLVEEGDDVRADQEIAILENDEQKIESARARTAYDTKRREYERAASLHEQGMLSVEEYENLRRESEELGHAADLADLQLARTVVRAPFSGRILTRHVDPGSTVAAGADMADIADLDPLYADVNVPEREIARLSAGQAVRISRDEDKASSTRAVIERIAPSVDPESGTVKVTLRVPRQRSLRPGSFVRVDVVTETHADALVLPRGAFVADGRRWHVFRVVDEDGLVERVEVERGFEDGDRVEIVTSIGAERPLSADDRVVTRGASALSDGARVDVIPQTAAAGAANGDEVGRVAP